MIAAPDRESLIFRTRALDRVLLWGHYVIPNWHIRAFRVAYWDEFSRPRVSPVPWRRYLVDRPGQSRHTGGEAQTLR
ncbi:MAG: hypothetical protein U1F68_11690 [Gammaproteobacteria bacterium]